MERLQVLLRVVIPVKTAAVYQREPAGAAFFKKSCTQPIFIATGEMPALSAVAKSSATEEMQRHAERKPAAGRLVL